MDQYQLTFAPNNHSRANVVALARSWIGTPYHHQASVKGAGCDCLGLVRGIYRELYGHEAQNIPPYSRDWSEVGRRETLLDAGRQHLIPTETALPGDVLIFRFQKTSIAKHAAIKVGNNQMIHAVENAPVCEVYIGRWWERRIAGCFAFPGCVD